MDWHLDCRLVPCIAFPGGAGTECERAAAIAQRASLPGSCELARRLDGGNVPQDMYSALAAIAVGDCDPALQQYLQYLRPGKLVEYANAILESAYQAAVQASAEKAVECTSIAIIATEQAYPDRSETPTGAQNAGLNGSIRIGIGRDTNVNSKSDIANGASTVLLPQGTALSDTFVLRPAPLCCGGNPEYQEMLLRMSSQPISITRTISTRMNSTGTATMYKQACGSLSLSLRRKRGSRTQSCPTDTRSICRASSMSWLWLFRCGKSQRSLRWYP